MSLRTSLVLVVAACLASPAAHGSPVNIDTFDLGSLQGHIFGRTDYGAYEVVADPNETLFGHRDIWIEPALNSGDGAAKFMVSGGRLAMDTLTTMLPYAARWTVEYGIRIPGFDLINDDGAPNTGVLLEFLSAEYACDVSVLLWQNYGMGGRRIASLSRTLPANPNPHQVFLPFSQFNDPHGPFDFTRVDAVWVEIHGAPDGEYELDRISANVPEPATMGLLALGALAVIRRRRRS